MSFAAGSARGSGGDFFTLTQALQLGHDQGINGGRIEDHLPHSEAFLEAVLCVDSEPGLLIDLGSGGGYPGLVLAVGLPTTEVILVEARQKRADFLARSVYALDLQDRVSVFNGDASALAETNRDSADIVTARSFAAPAIVAECGSPLLRCGGTVVVSEPPEGLLPQRWPTRELEALDLTPRAHATENGTPFALLEKTNSASSSIPRPRRSMERNPLF